jgi:hypothetical protein
VTRPLARRCGDGPLIHPGLLPGDAGDNINGPSLLRVPDWLGAPLGRYYLYFAHHRGDHIRLAVADRLEGPWRVHPGGTLVLGVAPGCHDHIASPDVHADDARRELRMYFHGPALADCGQRTFLATSRDGLHWQAQATILAPFYLRAFRWRDAWFGFAKGGDLYRSPDGVAPFALVGNPFAVLATHRPGFNHAGDIRHLAVDLHEDHLWAYHTRIGDAPERILRQRIALGGEPAAWRAEPEEEVLRPESAWEGADLPVTASVAGAAHGREHALRDPAIFRENGRCWLLYSVAGESGLALAEIRRA